MKCKHVPLESGLLVRTQSGIRFITDSKQRCKRCGKAITMTCTKLYLGLWVVAIGVCFGGMFLIIPAVDESTILTLVVYAISNAVPLWMLFFGGRMVPWRARIRNTRETHGDGSPVLTKKREYGSEF